MAEKKKITASGTGKKAAAPAAAKKPTAKKPAATASKTAAQQKKDVGKIAVAAVAAGAAAKKIFMKRVLAAIVAVLVTLVVAATGLLYYYDIAPLDFDLGGNFKWYSLPGLPFSSDGGDLRVHFLDANQGDCIIIQLPDGKNMMIDAGKNDNKLKDKIIKYIKDLEINTIHYGMLTHTDEDHCGGFDKVIKDPDITFLKMYQPLIKSKSPNCYVAEKFDNYGEMNDGNRIPLNETLFAASNIRQIDTNAYMNFIDAVKAENSEVIFSYAGQKIEGEGYAINFYNPDYDKYRTVNTATQKNDVSPMIILECNGKKMLLTGDGDDKAEITFLVNAGEKAKVDVLKVAHHGGSQSTSELFLNKVKPEYSVISVGKNNHGHPTKAVLDRLGAVGSKVFRTDKMGDIVLTVSGGKMGWKFYRDGQEYGTADDYKGDDLPALTKFMQKAVSDFSLAAPKAFPLAA